MSLNNFLQMFKQVSQSNENNNQTIVLHNGAKYCGSLKDGKPDGRGTLTYSNNQRYKGEFVNGLKHGKGELYIGDWFQNKKHGKGQYFYQNGNRYTGQFNNNVKHGWGRIDQDNGSYYEGYFFENNKDRTGQYFNAMTGKKYMQTYDKGKLMNQSKIIQGVNVHQQQQAETPQQLLKKISNKTRPPNQDQAKEQRQFCSLDPTKILTPNERIIHNVCVTECQPALQSFGMPSLKFKSFNDEQHQAIVAQNYVSQSLLVKKISLWNKQQVCTWLNQIGFGDCIQQFKSNNIQGDSLLQLQNDDLKELGVGALGDRRILLRQIQFLKLVMKSQCLGDSISKFYGNQITLDMIRQLQTKKNKKQSLKDQVIKAVQSDSSSSSSTDNDLNNKKQRVNPNQNSLKYKIPPLPPKKGHTQMSIQNKVENYLQKKGIKLTFLIPKDQIQIIRPIGKGGYGQVFEGRWLGQIVAVKKYLKKQGFRNRHVGHFIEEVQVINKLLHPSIVLYMGMCIYDNEYGMVTEFMKGGSLFDYLHKSRRKLTQEHIFYILKDVALGMSYLHGKNVLHCDLKSSNVLIDQSWNVKLCDFGLSRIHTTKKSKKKGLRVGTPHWMAPEILRGQKYEYQSDVYSYGILLWEILTGQIPYKDLSTAQIIGLVGNNEQHRIKNPTTSNQLFLNIFLLCTERDPKKRPTFKYIVDLLEKEEYKYQSNSNDIVRSDSRKKI